MTKEEFISKVKAMFDSIADKDNDYGIVLLFDTGDLELNTLIGGDIFKDAAMVTTLLHEHKELRSIVGLCMKLMEPNKAIRQPVVNTTNKSAS